jgi:hypothetical protein
MRYFKAKDGKLWSIRLDDGLIDLSVIGRRVGWEALLCETVPNGSQKVVYRPSGWLPLATAEDLAHALADAETVRSRWEEPPLP